VLGDYDLAQDEDCLHVNVVTPDLDCGKRPVVVWLFGGAFLSGGNAIPWYDGGGFARRHDIVFVGVNYRLGAFGFLHLEELGPGNLGLRDQVAALQWTQANIEQFGGDPDNVTLMGQSAGAISVLSLLAAPSTRDLFHRVIVQSARLSSLSTAHDTAASGHALLEHSGLSVDGLRRLPTDQVLALQNAHIRANARFGATSTPFRPFAGDDLVDANPLAEAVAGAAGKNVLVGWTRDEMSAFFCGNQEILDAGAPEIDAVFEREWGENWREGQQFARAARPGAAADVVFGAGLNECMFAGSAVTLAEKLVGHAPTWLYRFDWTAPTSRFGACHCIELPFVFGNTDTWDAPMLAGASGAAMRGLSELMQRTWAQFIRYGNPNHNALPHWAEYDHAKRTTLRIDEVVESISDLANVASPTRPWPARLPALNVRADHSKGARVTP